MRLVSFGLFLFVCLPIGCDRKSTNIAPPDSPVPSPIEAGEQFSLTKKSEFSSETNVEIVLVAELAPKSMGKMFDFGVQTKDGKRGPGGFGLESKWEITISGMIDSSSDAPDWWTFQYKVKGQSGSALIGDIKGPIRFSLPPGKRMGELLTLEAKASSYKIGDTVQLATARDVSGERLVTIRIYDDKKKP